MWGNYCLVHRPDTSFAVFMCPIYICRYIMHTIHVCLAGVTIPMVTIIGPPALFKYNASIMLFVSQPSVVYEHA